MSDRKPEVRALTLSPAIIKQSAAVLDAGDVYVAEKTILFGQLEDKKLVPSQFKGVNSAGGQALVSMVLIPRFTEECGESLVTEVMNPKYKQDHKVTCEERTITRNGLEIVIPRTTRTIKGWKNTYINKPLGRLLDGYVEYLGGLEKPLHENASGKLVQVPAGTKKPASPRNEVPEIAHANVRQSVNFIRGRQKVIGDLVAKDKADTADRVVLKWCDEGLQLFRGYLPKHDSKKKSKSDK
jgi:hypothetical protein